MDVMKKASELPFMEGRDCPICLCTFEENDDIWQLKCSEVHREHSMAEMLSGEISMSSLGDPLTNSKV